MQQQELLINTQQQQLSKHNLQSSINNTGLQKLVSNYTAEKSQAINLKHNTQDDLDLFRVFEKTKVRDKEGKVVSFDIKIRNELAVRNQKLVSYVMKKYLQATGKTRLYPRLEHDMFQEGMIGLMNAIISFDVERGNKFSTYCTWHIHQACIDYISDIFPEIYIPAHIRAQKNKVLTYLKEQNIDISLIDEKMAIEQFGMTDRMLMSVKSAITTNKIDSYSANIDLNSKFGADATKITRILTDSRHTPENTDSQIDAAKIIAAAKRAITKLTPREKTILLMRFSTNKDISSEANILKQEEIDLADDTNNG